LSPRTTARQAVGHNPSFPAAFNSPLNSIDCTEKMEKRGKAVHLIRHGEANHNVAARTLGRQEYQSWTHFDPALTSLGQEQALALYNTHFGGMTSKPTTHQPEVVVVSPLLRTLQTAFLAFRGSIPESSEHHQEHKHGIKFIAFEHARERFGRNPCDKRRPVSELKRMFPMVDFSLITDDEDTQWTEEREKGPHVQERARHLLTWLQARPESCIAVVSHCSFLTNFFKVLHRAEEGIRWEVLGSGIRHQKEKLQQAVEPLSLSVTEEKITIETKTEQIVVKVRFNNGELKSIALYP